MIFQVGEDGHEELFGVMLKINVAFWILVCLDPPCEYFLSRPDAHKFSYKGMLLHELNIFHNTIRCNFIFWDSVDLLKVDGCGSDFILVLISLWLENGVSVIDLILSFSIFKVRRSVRVSFYAKQKNGLHGMCS
jgi:hypothetical protein